MYFHIKTLRDELRNLVSPDRRLAKRNAYVSQSAQGEELLQASDAFQSTLPPLTPEIYEDNVGLGQFSAMPEYDVPEPSWFDVEPIPHAELHLPPPSIDSLVAGHEIAASEPMFEIADAIEAVKSPIEPLDTLDQIMDDPLDQLFPPLFGGF